VEGNDDSGVNTCLPRKNRYRSKKTVTTRKTTEFDKDHHQAVEIICNQGNLPKPIREFRFAAPDRKWRFDFCWPDFLLALEIEGGVFASYAGHRNMKKYLLDMEKYNAAALHGYRLIRATTRDLKDGTLFDLLNEYFRQHPLELIYNLNKGRKPYGISSAPNKRKSCPF